MASDSDCAQSRSPWVPGVRASAQCGVTSAPPLSHPASHLYQTEDYSIIHNQGSLFSRYVGNYDNGQGKCVTHEHILIHIIYMFLIAIMKSLIIDLIQACCYGLNKQGDLLWFSQCNAFQNKYAINEYYSQV